MRKVLFLLTILFAASSTFAQVDLRVSNPKSGFPIAIPQGCDSGGGNPYDTKLAAVLRRDLDLSGFFSVLEPSSYVETPGKCNLPNGIQFSDWSVIGTDWVIKSSISGEMGTVKAEFYLFDVQLQKAVLGKRYSGDVRFVNKLAHKFANEVIRYFTNTPGIFGGSIVFVSRSGRFKELYEMDLDGDNLRQLTRERGLAVSPSYSLDGQSVVYTSYRTRKPELFLLSLATGAAKQVTNREGLEVGAKFLKDGSGLICSASFDGISNIVTFNMQGQVTRKVTQGGFLDVSPSVSPDGGRFAFVSSRGAGPQVFTTSIAGGEPTRISFTGSNYCTSPNWSPKGDKIAFTCLSGGNQVFVAGADGSNALQLTFGGNNEDPSFSPDGRYILFSSSLGGKGRSIMLLPLHTGQPRQITSGPGEDSQPIWGPIE
jgi:TolB protein